MSDITSTFRITIIGLMIVSGAINTLGSHLFIQHINSKIGNSYMRDHIISTFSIPTCKPLPCSLVNFWHWLHSFGENVGTHKNSKWTCLKLDPKENKLK